MEILAILALYFFSVFINMEQYSRQKMLPLNHRFIMLITVSIGGNV